VKSMPAALMSLIVTSSGLTLVRIADLGGLLTPTACEPKPIFAGEMARELAGRWGGATSVEAWTTVEWITKTKHSAWISPMLTLAPA
jgi:hypothetical protein